MPRPCRYPETAKRLRGLMEAHNIASDSELARRAVVGRATVGGWLAGQFRPGGEKLERLAKMFKVSPAYILGLDESGGMNSASSVSLALASVKRARAELDAVIAVLEEQLDPNPLATAETARSPEPGELVAPRKNLATQKMKETRSGKSKKRETG